MSWLRRSLSARLLGIFLVTAIVALFVLVMLFSRGLGAQWRRSIEPHLAQYVNYMRDDLGYPPSEARARELASHLPIDLQVERNGEQVFHTSDQDIDIQGLRFRTRHRRPHTDPANTNDPLNPINLADPAGLAGGPAGDHALAFNEDTRRPVLRFQQNDYIVYVELERPQGRGRGRDELLWAVAAMAGLLGLCFLGIRHQLAPVARLQLAVQRMSQGDLSSRANESGVDDLAQLANSIDAMAARLQQMLDAKRELLLSISHELRSPLTRARLACELLPESTRRLQLIEDIDIMERLIEQLVESERLAEHSVLNSRNVDMRTLIDDAIDDVLDEAQATVIWHAPAVPVTLWGDAARLGVLVRNLLDNAVRHGRRDTDEPSLIRISLAEHNDGVRFEVCDQGPGIEPAHLDSLTEAFYRPDASRTRLTGGYGLGLFLCRRIAEAHGGTLHIESPSPEGVGTRVSVVLPHHTSGDPIQTGGGP